MSVRLQQPPHPDGGARELWAITVVTTVAGSMAAFLQNK
jgi:hypothetical protein